MKLAALLLILEFFLIHIIICMTTIIAYKERKECVILKIPHQGYVLGRIDRTAWSKQNFMHFCALPYAEAPSGPLRYKAPLSKTPWSGCIDGTKMGRNCPSISTIPKPMDTGDTEDCLNLCVYTRSLNSNYPVIFYIYGGGFNNGTALDYPPKYMMEKNIVLVVPQFRVGVLGWGFSHSTDIPGNMALLDLQLALKWIQQNIVSFGGDASKVTIMGQSGGACMASALMLSPRSESNYFKHVIVMSGSVLSSWAINEHPQLQLKRICRNLGCKDCENHKILILCLNNANVSGILEASRNEFFSPVLEDIHGVLPKQPLELVNTLNHSMPVLTGFTKHDGSFAVALYYDRLKQMNCNFSMLTVKEFAGGVLNIIDGQTNVPPSLLKCFFGQDLLNSINHKNAIPGYIDLCGTVIIKSGVLKLASQLVRKRSAPVYLYSFDYQGQYTRFGYGFPTDHYPFNGGVHHSDENIYLFSQRQLNMDDTRMAKKMVELWTTFAATGRPFHENVPMLPPMHDESGPYFSINKKTIVKYNVIQELRAASKDPNKIKLMRRKREF